LEQDDDEFDLDKVLLMITINSHKDYSSWYCDIDFSNHMTRNRRWLINLNPNVKKY